MKTGIPAEYKNIDEYIALQPDNLKETFELLRQTIRQAASEAEELISSRCLLSDFKVCSAILHRSKTIIAFFIA